MRPRSTAILFLFLFVLVAGACVSDGEAAVSESAGADPTEVTGPDPTEVDPRLVAEIEAELESWMAEGETPVPGVTLAVLLADGQEIRVAAGVANLKSGEEVETSDYFRIGSVTKTITSAVVLQLVEEGKVALDEPVATYLGDDWITGYELDGVDYADDVTVRDLLSHTDGFAEFAWDIGFYAQTADRLDRAYEPQELLDWGAEQKPLFPPGTDYAYNTVGHVAAGLLIEEVTGNTADEELRTRILEPLGLDNTFLPPETNPPEEVVRGYAVGELRDALEQLPQAGRFRELGVVGDDDEYYDMLALPQDAITSAGWTGGGIEAQVADIAAIFRAMFDGTLLDEESVEAFTTPNAFSDYGLGVSVGEELGTPVYNHGGGVPGFRSHAAYYPELDVSIALSANAVPIEPDVGELAERILDIVN